MHVRLSVLIVLAATSVPAAAQTADSLLLDRMFRDHAVLQRDRPIGIRGRAAPGEQVTVELAGRRASAAADASGRWTVSLPALRAGGPHTLDVRAASGAHATASDILVGDVWLCSGQSNMEWSVTASLGGAEELARPVSGDSLRLLTIAHASSLTPLDAFTPPATWQVASPQTVRTFSAACYYFAKDLQRTERVPMGLINASWGGSAIGPWISASGIGAMGGFDESLELLRLRAASEADAGRRFGAGWERWWKGKAPGGSTPWLDSAGGSRWRDVPEPMRNYKEWGVPELARHDGMIWYRRAFTLSAEQAASGGSLSLGGIDEVDQTWVNGMAIGNTFGWGTPRTYPVPAGVLRPGTNWVTVNVLNTWAAGGMTGPAERLSLTPASGPVVSLAGQWQYQAAPVSMGQPPRAPWESIGGLTTLYNAMIAPLGPIGLRGALWYQGESNTAEPESYQRFLAGLMADWRSRFRADLPFLIVQLPNFGAVPTGPQASGWAELREAQRRAVEADARAALAVTIDIGEPADLHPPNKRDVGLRLARAARHLVYGERVTPSGPRVRDARRAGGGVEVRFRDVEGALAAEGASPVGFELCGADQASCRWVRGTVQRDRVWVEGVEGATRVRYCWGEAPRCNLLDGSGLPAGPFEVPIR